MAYHQENLNTIMIQGTASDAGKSIVVTALCRILARDNLRVAPFKSWNMSLNSYVTEKGGEIGIAQAIQASAAGLKATVDMQPILVKPKGNGESQVIIRGKPLGDFTYRKKNDYLEKAEETIEKSLNNLAREYDFIVMEGAGSPVEINRKNEDLANMKVARMNKTPVLLVVDIDRGGALASIVGTLKLLPPEERKLVKGIIINKFRGDIDLLKPGIEFLEKYTSKPVIGVIPYLNEIMIPEEDSASLINKIGIIKREKINIGIINLPHMSNFTDFKSLELEPDVNLIYINSSRQLDNLDLLIIPGTKTTTKDLKYLKKAGLADKIIELAGEGLPVIGICGGYQMMGEKLIDNYQTEGEIERINGLGILPIETRFIPAKTTHQVKVEINDSFNLFSNLICDQITGYEIHMGDTQYLGQAEPLFQIRERSKQEVRIADGAFSDVGNCFGTYLHGLFNNDSFRRGIINRLRKDRGLEPLDMENSSYLIRLESSFDKIADIFSEQLDLDYIYSLMNIY